MIKYTILPEHVVNCLIEAKEFSDFCLLTGAGRKSIRNIVSSLNYGVKLVGIDDMILRYYTSTQQSNNTVTVHSLFHSIDGYHSTNLFTDEHIKSREVAVRPAIIYSPNDQEELKLSSVYQEVTEEQYGYFPKNAASKYLQKKLEKLYNKNLLTITKNKYTKDSVHIKEIGKPFSPMSLQEYEYRDSRYVRILSDIDRVFILSNGQVYHKGVPVWIKVEPIIWYNYKNEHILLARDPLIAGLQYNAFKLPEIDFDVTDLSKYLNVYFSREIMQIEKEKYSSSEKNTFPLLNELLYASDDKEIDVSNMHKLSELLSRMEELSKSAKSRKENLELLNKKYLEEKAKAINILKNEITEYLLLENEYRKLLNENRHQMIDSTIMDEEERTYRLTMRNVKSYIEEQ